MFDHGGVELLDVVGDDLRVVVDPALFVFEFSPLLDDDGLEVVPASFDFFEPGVQRFDGIGLLFGVLLPVAVLP